jgi:hypothetical protein
MEVPEGPWPPAAQQVAGAGSFGPARRADPKDIARADDPRQLREAMGQRLVGTRRRGLGKLVPEAGDRAQIFVADVHAPPRKNRSAASVGRKAENQRYHATERARRLGQYGAKCEKSHGSR